MKPMSSNRGLLVAVLAISTGCATFVNPSTQPVTIVSDPPAAEVIVDSEGMGSTPTDVLLRRSDSEAAVRLQKDGFAPRVVRPPAVPQPMVDRQPRGACPAKCHPRTGRTGSGFPREGRRLSEVLGIEPAVPTAGGFRRDGRNRLSDGPDHHRGRLRVSRYGAHRASAGCDRVDGPAPGGRHRVGARFPPGPHRWRVSRRTGTAEEPAGRPMTSRPSRPTAARLPCTSTGDVLRLLLSKYKG